MPGLKGIKATGWDDVLCLVSSRWSHESPYDLWKFRHRLVQHAGNSGGDFLWRIMVTSERRSLACLLRVSRSRQDLSPIQMMLVMTAFSTIFSFVTLVHQDELMPFFNFVSNHPEIHLHFVAFGVCSTIGQLLIFHTIRSFGAVVFAIIMTVSSEGYCARSVAMDRVL